jgi:hypothetical protein
LYRFIYLKFLDYNKLAWNNKHQQIYGTQKLNPATGRIKEGNLNEGRIQPRKIGKDWKRRLNKGED